MSEKIVNSTIDILGKLYPIRCQEKEVPSLQAAADLLNIKMKEVQESGKAINLERIAVITALNLAHQFLMLDQQKNHVIANINDRISLMHDRLDTTLNQAVQTELIYSTE